MSLKKGKNRIAKTFCLFIKTHLQKYVLVCCQNNIQIGILMSTKFNISANIR